MLPPANRDAGAKARAAAAAAVAAASVTPGQRDRAIEQAVLAAQQEREAAAAAAAAARDSNAPEEVASGLAEQGEPAAAAPAGHGAPSAPGTYEPPEWSGVPDGADFGLEVLKNGTLVEERPLQGQACFTFGRSPTADVLLEHPSASRLHAVLQFKGGSREAFLFDCGSTHGTFLNRNRLKAHVHAPVRVGDTIRFGQSSRLYVLTGPAELMPQEGLSKQQKKQLKLLEAAQARKEADELKARAQMEAAIAGSAAAGATWGMSLEDDEGDEEGPAKEVNWRSYVDKHGSNLTDRQTKLLDKIRKREYKIKNLEAECSKIAAKEKTEGGLTQGQASTLVRNERALDVLREELEELEDQLTDCISDSIKGKQAAKDSKDATAAKKKRKRQHDSDDEYADASDSGDEFYDRTVAGGVPGPKKKAGAAAKAAEKAPQQVESAETLYVKRSALLEEVQRLEAAIAAEQQFLEQQQQQHQAAAAAGSSQQQEGGAGGGSDAAAADSAGTEPAEADMGAAATAGGDGVDSLDAFMEDVTEKMELDKLSSLKKELEAMQQQLQRTHRLIHIADPHGWYQPQGSGSSSAAADGASSDAGAAAAAAARAAAKQALEADRQRRAAAVAAQRAGWAAAHAGEELPPEEEEEEEGNEHPTAAAAGDELDSSRQQQQQQEAGSSNSKAGTAPAAAAKPVAVVIKPKGLLATAQLRQKTGGAPLSSKPAAAGSAAGGEGDTSAAQAAAQQLMKEFAQPVAAVAAKRAVKGPTLPPHAFKAPAAKQSAAAKEGGSNVNAAAAARVAASIAILTSHRAPIADDEGQQQQHTGRQQGLDDEAGGWLPPADQTGDGKSSLNAKFGY